MAYPKFLRPFIQFLPYRKHSPHFKNKLVIAVQGNAVYKKVKKQHHKFMVLYTSITILKAQFLYLHY